MFLLIFIVFMAGYAYLSNYVIQLSDFKLIFNQTASKAINDLEQYEQLGHSIINDLGQCYNFILWALAFGAALTFFWILLLKYNAKIVVWTSILSLPLLFTYALYLSISQYIYFFDYNNKLQNNHDPDVDEQTLPFDQALQTIITSELLSYTRNSAFWLILSIVILFALIALTITLHGLQRRIRLSIALIREASKAINDVKSTLLFPIIPRILGIVVILYGIFIALLLISANHPAYRFNNSTQLCNPAKNPPTVCMRHQLIPREHIWKIHAYNLFAVLWLIHFISGITKTTLAGAFASYYWTFRKPRDVPFFAVTSSLWQVIRHHLGSIAFGSFLIATIRYIRIILELIDKRLRDQGTNNGVNTSLRSINCIWRVFFWLLDGFLKYINRNAYIMMSMYHEGYFASAKRALNLLLNNSTKALVLDYVTDFLLLISRILVTCLTGCIIFFIFNDNMFEFLPPGTIEVPKLQHKWLPLVIVMVGTYFIAKGFFNVYNMAVDTLFICFLIDCENNDGFERPYYMSKGLRKLLNYTQNVSPQSALGPPKRSQKAKLAAKPSAPSLSQLANITQV